jgi:hypothetical protein
VDHAFRIQHDKGLRFEYGGVAAVTFEAHRLTVTVAGSRSSPGTPLRTDRRWFKGYHTIGGQPSTGRMKTWPHCSSPVRAMGRTRVRAPIAKLGGPESRAARSAVTKAQAARRTARRGSSPAATSGVAVVAHHEKAGKPALGSRAAPR